MNTLECWSGDKVDCLVSFRAGVSCISDRLDGKRYKLH